MSKHVQNTDTSVLERRLRPIYDWLDIGNNKKALQECDKVLKKTPNCHCAKALKALTLLRMGREHDTNVILDNLTKEKPVEEATLQAMALCYREMQQLDKICKLYEIAVKLNPSNEELHTHLFMSYVRISDFKAQQLTAMALYKQKPKNPYYCWNVMSIVLQATRGEGANDPIKRSLLLNLAERMMQKLIDDNKMDAEQEVQLYIIVLDLQQKYDRILDVLNGCLSQKLQCSNIPNMKLSFLKKLGKWQQVNILCKSILNECFDKWDIWKDYVNSVFELSDMGVNGDSTGDQESDVDTYDNTAEKCHEFICGIIESGAENSFLLRGPYLARFELCSKLQEKNIKTEDILGDKIELFIEYFRKFGHKPCCVFDLRIYLKLLDAEQKSELATKLIKEVGIGSTSVPQSAEQMQRHIGALQLSRLCGGHRNLSTEHLRALVTALTLHYQHGYQSYGKDLPSTDIGPSDNYAILAAHILYDLSRKEDGENSLIAALALLESLLKNSPSNFHAKLLALKFYHILGCGKEANSTYYSLDIKHLQLDSLGYIHCGRLATTGLYSLCAIHFDSTLKFFSSNFKDSTDHLTFSYKFGSFMKLDEFMDFREKMNNSLHYTTVVVDKIMMSLIECSTLDGLYNTDISFKENKIEWEKLRDNRDLRVYVSWEPEFSENLIEDSDEIKKLFQQDLNFLKLRTHMLWSINAGLQVLKSIDGTRKKNIENMKNILKDWKDLEDEIRKTDISPISEELVSYPLRSRLHSFLDVPYRSIVSSLLHFFESLTTEDIETTEQKCKLAGEELETLGQMLEETLSGNCSYFREKRKGVELAVNAVEVVCIACVVCIMSNELVKPTSQTKKSKKKQPMESKLKEFVNIINEIRCQIIKIALVVEKWCGEVNEKDLINMLESLNLGSDSPILFKNICMSYASTNKEIQGLLSNKLKMLEDRLKSVCVP
ncbi:phagocyte signaling impaired [Rhynchophorus ferrugineus]|uniref:phagocyte signaling impaired n=1 Tax=Rhynchophorus ferrugineus TaxID=354439 RepID=UPI003FCC6034